jgi:hypothetical protein
VRVDTFGDLFDKERLVTKDDGARTAEEEEEDEEDEEEDDEPVGLWLEMYEIHEITKTEDIDRCR